MMSDIRRVIQSDIPELKVVLDSSGLFPSDLLDDMISDYLNNKESHDIWFTATERDTPVAIGYCAPEKLTDGTFNLYAIAVKKDCQGLGVGKRMMNYLESKLTQEGARILLVETSGKSDYALTRKFYLQCDYVKQAVIPEFYEKDDDKVIFWKKLN
jgi:Acetyltransferases